MRRQFIVGLPQSGKLPLVVCQLCLGVLLIVKAGRRCSMLGHDGSLELSLCLTHCCMVFGPNSAPMYPLPCVI